MSKNVYITETNCITPLGFDINSTVEAIANGVSGIKYFESSSLLKQPFYSGIIDSEKIDEWFSKIEENSHFSRLEKMMILALKPLVKDKKITSRTAFVLSTTKGNISALENKNNPIEAVHLSSLAKKIATYFKFETEQIVVSNACISGILAIAVAKRIIQFGVYDDVFVVAGDEVSEFVLSGFNSFQAMSTSPCKPYDKNRNGVNLGEAAAAVYMTSDKNQINNGTVKVLGDGSINDANHISGPSRTGEGLFRSIESAMKEARITSENIDYISAHGTATLYNDEMEAVAFNRLRLQKIPVNSYKGYFGHTLGASGLLETVVSIAFANKNMLIASQGFEEMGVTQPINIIRENSRAEILCFLKTASGFGGCNAAIILQKVQ